MSNCTYTEHGDGAPPMFTCTLQRKGEHHLPRYYECGWEDPRREKISLKSSMKVERDREEKVKAIFNWWEQQT